MSSLSPLTGPLGEKNAAHLLRRATFGPTIKNIKDFASKTADESINILFQDVSEPLPPKDPLTTATWLNPKAGEGNSKTEDLLDYFMAWHLEQMRNSGTNIKERIVYFFHTHLPVNITKVVSSEAVFYQNKLFRYYAFGNFKTLFKKICIDNAMLVYIDGTLNESSIPNENFAREMFELYSIGKGPQIDDGNYTNYTEGDIKAAMKILTGWKFDDTFTNIDTDTGIPIGKLETSVDGGKEVATLHDSTQIVFTSAFQNQTIEPFEKVGGYATKEAALKELDDMIEMIFGEQETAKFLCRKLYRFFVYHQISEEVENDIITPLANTFTANNYELQPVLKQLLKSQHFFDSDNSQTSDNNIGALIKSPIEQILGSLRFFNVTLPDIQTQLQELYVDTYQKTILGMLSNQGLDFYEPYDVAGYDAYFQLPTFNRYWITPRNLAMRYYFSNYLIDGKIEGENIPFKADIVAWVDNSDNINDPSDASQILDAFTNYMISVELSEDRYNYFLNTVFLDTLSSSYWTAKWNAYKGGGADTEVRNDLENLVKAIMQTPEFQLF